MVPALLTPTTESPLFPGREKLSGVTPAILPESDNPTDHLNDNNQVSTFLLESH
jgi:hypothetical protein